MRAVYDASAIAAAAVAAAAAAAVEAGRRGRLRGGSARLRRWVRIVQGLFGTFSLPCVIHGKAKVRETGCNFQSHLLKNYFRHAATHQNCHS